jgi:hypothetical protein
MKKKLVLALCLAALATPVSARNAEDYWCGKPSIHLMMWIAKVQVWARDDEGKLIRDKDGNLVWGGFGGETYEQYGIINHKLPPDHPKWVTVVPERWIRLTKDNIYFRGQKCTVFTEKDQEKYGVGYFGPREDLRYPFQKGKIPEVIKPTEPRVSEPSTTRFCVSVIEPTPEVVKDPEYNEDKWLALREGPGPQFKLITKLGGYEHLEADATKGDWTHISNVARLSSTERNSPQIVQGWVRSKYVKKFPCENETADEVVIAPYRYC